MSYPATKLLSPNIVHYWQMGEATGTTAVDSVTSGAVDGAYSGTYTLGMTGIPAGGTSVAFAGIAGSTEGMATEADLGLRLGCAFEGWYKTTDTGAERQVIFCNGDTTTGYALVLNGNGTVNGRWWLLCNSRRWYDSDCDFPDDNEWHHFALNARVGSYTFDLYVDKVFIHSFAIDFEGFNTPNSFHIGSDGSSAFVGQICHLAAYSAPLTLDQIAEAHDGGLVTPGGEVSVSATTSFSLAGTAHGYLPAVYSVSASTSFVVAAGVSAVVHVPTAYSVSATTSFSVHTTASCSVPRNRFASASTRIILTVASGGYTSPIFVSATTGFSIGCSTRQLAIGPKYVSATTAFVVSNTAKVGRLAIYYVSASTGFSVGSAARSNADRVVSASTGFSVGGTGRQNRAIHVSATTSVGFSTVQKTNNFLALAATSTVVFTASAHHAVTGTLAESRIVLTDLAQAVVWIPWRRNALSIPPGGNLPHS